MDGRTDGRTDSMAHRVHLVEPPVACQASLNGFPSADSDIQNFVVVQGEEMHLSDPRLRKVMLAARARQQLQLLQLQTETPL